MIRRLLASAVLPLVLAACGSQAVAPETSSMPISTPTPTATPIVIHVVASVWHAEARDSYIAWQLCALDQSNAPVVVTAFAFSRSIRYSAGWSAATGVSHLNPGSTVPNCVEISANKPHALGVKFSGTVTHQGLEYPFEASV